ncbi:MAG: BlaI/MecI/CopY family transcriptional regulator [Planctomycetaceae bacterium]
MREYRLTYYELQLMDVLWKLGAGTVQDVCDNLTRDLAYSTVMTTLNLLATRKRVLSREKVGRAFVYRPQVSRDEVSRSMLGDLRSVLFADRLPSLMLNLIKEDAISPADVDAIRAALDQLQADEDREPPT